VSKWRVDFHGYLSDPHMARLDEAGIEYQSGASERGPGGEFRSGLPRNVVIVEADDQTAAEQAVRDAIGPDADGFTEWRVRPA
jgi:hypothetical protein